MLEVQSALIESINEPTINGFKTPRRAMEPQQNQSMPTSNLQNQPEHENTNQSLRFWQHLQTNLNTEQGEKQTEKSSNFDKKILFIGSLSSVVTEEDLYELFGCKRSSYLQKTSKVELFVCRKTGNSNVLSI